MKTLLVVLALALSATVQASEFELPTPYTAALEPAVPCAPYATIDPYKTVVTHFSADGNYVLGQVASHYTCGCRGRGCLHTYYVCTFLQWDLAGNLVSTSTPSNGLANINCPSVGPLSTPATTPPSSSVLGNEFTNSGGYTAETVVEEICGSIACYATYYLPTLVTP